LSEWSRARGGSARHILTAAVAGCDKLSWHVWLIPHMLSQPVILCSGGCWYVSCSASGPLPAILDQPAAMTWGGVQKGLERQGQGGGCWVRGRAKCCRGEMGEERGGCGMVMWDDSQLSEWSSSGAAHIAAVTLVTHMCLLGSLHCRCPGAPCFPAAPSYYPGPEPACGQQQQPAGRHQDTEWVEEPTAGV
jgi:hypothetical protein